MQTGKVEIVVDGEDHILPWGQLVGVQETTNERGTKPVIFGSGWVGEVGIDLTMGRGAT